MNQSMERASPTRFTAQLPYSYLLLHLKITKSAIVLALKFTSAVKNPSSWVLWWQVQTAIIGR